MKTNLNSAFAALIAALALVSCAVNAVEEYPEEALMTKANSFKVSFTTASDVETKTSFGAQDEGTTKYPVFWTGNDTKISMSMNLAEPVEAAVNKDSEVSGKANFTATFSGGSSPYVFYAFSPLSAVKAISPSRESWTVTIPTVQTPTSDGLSCDESAMLLYAKSDEMEKIPTDPIELQFNHIATYCRLILKNLSSVLDAGSTVKTVDVTYSVPVAGSWYVNATTGAIKENEASYTISLKPTIADLSQPTDIWFALAPCTLDGQSVKVSVNTDKGSLSRTFTYGTRTYKAGGVNKLSLDMTKGSSYTNYDDDPVIANDEYGAYLNDIIYRYEPVTSQLSREFGASTTFAILYPADTMVIEFKGIPSGAAKGDTFTLELNKLTAGKTTAVGSYAVTVVKEDGAKLWLSDLHGNGFIVKR